MVAPAAGSAETGSAGPPGAPTPGRPCNAASGAKGIWMSKLPDMFVLSITVRPSTLDKTRTNSATGTFPPSKLDAPLVIRTNTRPQGGGAFGPGGGGGTGTPLTCTEAQ